MDGADAHDDLRGAHFLQRRFGDGANPRKLPAAQLAAKNDDVHVRRIDEHVEHRETVGEDGEVLAGDQRLRHFEGGAATAQEDRLVVAGQRCRRPRDTQLGLVLIATRCMIGNSGGARCTAMAPPCTRRISPASARARIALRAVAELMAKASATSATETRPCCSTKSLMRSALGSTERFCRTITHFLHTSRAFRGANGHEMIVSRAS